MYIKAVIEQGEVKLLEPINLKHDKVNIKLIIPDNEIIKNSQPDEETRDNPYKDFSPEIQQMMRELDEIRNRPLDESEVSELTEEQEQRFRAFSCREEFKSE